MIFSGAHAGSVPVLASSTAYKNYGYIWYVDPNAAAGVPTFACPGIRFAQPIGSDDLYGVREAYMQTGQLKYNQMSLAVRSGSSADYTNDSDFPGCYWDSNAKKFVYLSVGQSFTCRPYFFDKLYDSSNCTIRCNFFNVDSTKRAHFKNTITDSTTGLYIVPLFVTPWGMAAPADWTGLGLSSATSASSGIACRDKIIVCRSSGYVRDENNKLIDSYICGVAVVYSSTGSGSLINSVGDSYFVGQTDGVFTVDCVGAVVSDLVFGLNTQDSVFLTSQVLRSYMPYAAGTMDGLKQVSVDIEVVG